MTEEKDPFWEKIAEKFHGELSIDEEAEFIRQIDDRAGLLDFNKAQKIYDQLTQIGLKPYQESGKSWEKVESGIKGDQLRWLKVFVKYAAIIIVAFIAGNMIKLFTPAEKEIRYSEIRAPHGQMSKVVLPDGTRIWLNSGTTIRYPDRFTAEKREVAISGEAYFEVARMPKNPFTVKTSNLQVEVTGTSFNVSAYKDDPTTSVTLVEGKVELKDNNGKTIARLNPGQLAVKSKNNSNVNIKDVETSFYKAWIDGRIFFDDQPLDQIATKLERWFNVDIEFATERLKNYKFTGTILKNKPLDQIMQALELLAPIRFKHQVNATGKDKITIYKRT